MVDKLSKEELLKILAKAATPAKPRKKAERTAEQEQELRDRLAKMREKSLESRAAKADKRKQNSESSVPSAGSRREISKALDLAASPKEDLFEKKYGSTLEKLSETMCMLGKHMELNNSHLGEIKQMKLSKAEQRKKDMVVKMENSPPAPQATPPIRNETPTTPITAVGVMEIPSRVEPIVKSVLGGNPLRDYKKMSFGRR